MKRFILVFCILACLVFSVSAQEDKAFARSTLPPDNLDDVMLATSSAELTLYYDAFIKSSDGSIYKKFGEAFYDISFLKNITFKDASGNVVTGVIKNADLTSLRVWVIGTDKKIQSYTNSGPKATLIDGSDISKSYLRVIGLPENIYRLVILVNYNTQTQSGSVVVRTLILGVTRSFGNEKK